MRNFMYLVALALAALAVTSCNILNDYGNAACKENPAWCAPGGATGGSPAGTAACSPSAACDDGQGGILQSVGENCGTYLGGGSNCCSGLVCVDPSTGQPLLPNTGDSQGFCQGTLSCPQPQGPNWQGLTTTILRQIAIANKINGCDTQTGITQSRTIGVAFETWVLKTMGQLSTTSKRWTTPIFSQQRKNANNGGLPASVIPEFVDSQVAITLSAPLNLTWDYFLNSLFYEVKAVTGNLTLGTSQWQILGLLDVATSFPTVPPAPATHAPPAVIFTSTSNTVVAQDVVTKAITLKVGVWQQKVFYDANSATPNNPLLHLEQAACLTPVLYPSAVSLTTFYWLDPGAAWPDNPLTWVTVPEQASVVVPGDPDPAEVD